MGEAGAGSGRVLGCSGLFHFQRGGLAEPSVSGQCEGSLAGDAPRSLCEVGARCWGCPGGISKEEPCGRGVPALRGAVGSASLWDWGLWGRGSLLWVEGFSIPPSMSG